MPANAKPNSSAVPGKSREASPRKAVPEHEGESSDTRALSDTPTAPAQSKAGAVAVPRAESPAEPRLSDAIDEVNPSNDPVVSPEECKRLFTYYWKEFHPFWPVLYKVSLVSLVGSAHSSLN